MIVIANQYGFALINIFFNSSKSAPPDAPIGPAVAPEAFACACCSNAVFMCAKRLNFHILSGAQAIRRGRRDGVDELPLRAIRESVRCQNSLGYRMG